MKELLISLLQTFGYPVKLQGTIGKDEQYPDSFFTFWNGDTFDGDHFDNVSIYYVWDFQVNFYSTDPELVQSVLMQAKALLKANGFIISGKGYDVPSDEKTHTGRGMSVQIIDNI